MISCPIFSLLYCFKFFIKRQCHATFISIFLMDITQLKKHNEQIKTIYKLMYSAFNESLHCVSPCITVGYQSSPVSLVLFDKNTSNSARHKCSNKNRYATTQQQNEPSRRLYSPAYIFTSRLRDAQITLLPFSPVLVAVITTYPPLSPDNCHQCKSSSSPAWSIRGEEDGVLYKGCWVPSTFAQVI